MAGANRYLIVNADDFGLSPGINRGILAAHAHGIVGSASLMVRWPAAAEAAAAAREPTGLSLGLHIDLGEWTCRDGTWHSLYQVVPLRDRDAVAAEIERQLATFRGLTGRDPAHFDSHQHVHLNEPARSELIAVSQRLGVPLRHFTPGIRYLGDFYGQDDVGNSYPENVGVAQLVNRLTSLEAGWTELACHPGYAEPALDTMYVAERSLEVAALCDPEVRATLVEQKIELRTFAEFCCAAGEIA